jgi:hypothetical protein
MQYFHALRVRVLATSALLVMATVLAACAGTPAAPPPVAAGSAGTTGMGGGQLELTVFDQAGAPIDQADVTVLSNSGASFRVRGRTNRAGSVSFSRLPTQVRVQVLCRVTRQIQEGPLVLTRTFRGNGEEHVEISERGVTPVRMTIELIPEQ